MEFVSQQNDLVLSRDVVKQLAAQLSHVTSAWISMHDRLLHAYDFSERHCADLTSLINTADDLPDVAIRSLIRDRFPPKHQLSVMAFGLPRKDPAWCLANNCPVEQMHSQLRIMLENSQNAMSQLTNHIALGKVPSRKDLSTIVERTIDLVSLAKSEPAFYFSGSLYNSLHSSIEQVSTSCSSDLTKLLDSLATMCLRAGHAEQTLVQGALKDALEGLSADCPEKGLRSAAVLKVLASELLPSHEVTSVHAGGCSASTLRIVAVDDEAIWRDFVRETTDIVRDRLNGTMSVAFVEASTATVARDLLLKNNSKTSPDVLTIAVVDMGLPDETLNSDLSGTLPSRDVGHALLHRLRSYANNVPCVVLTTPSNTAEDMLRACSQGVSPREYVLKSQSHNDLAEAIVRLCVQARQYEISYDSESPSRSFCLDGIQISLDPMHFRTFCALADLSGQTRSMFFSRDQILDRLDQLFNHEYNYSGQELSVPDQAKNLTRDRFWQFVQYPNWPSYEELERWIIDWHHLKKESAGSLKRAITKLAQEFGGCWDRIGFVFNTYRVKRPHPAWMSDGVIKASHNSVEEFASWFDLVFGGIATAAPRYNDVLLHDHILEIRECIHRGFQLAHRFVEPRNVVRTGPIPSGGYRILAKISQPFDEEVFDDTWTVNEADPPRVRSGHLIRVLVVEDDDLIRNRIVDLLTLDGFQVDFVSSCKSADPDNIVTPPDILCLDIALPQQDESDEISVDNGLDLLRRFACAFPQCRIACVTSFANTDSIKLAAHSAGVELEYIVSKSHGRGGQDWAARLLSVMAGLRNELSGLVGSPPEMSVSRPIVTVLPQTDFATGRMALSVNGQPCRRIKAGDQGRLLGWFIRNPEQEYDAKQIVIDFDLPSGNSLKKLIQYLRQKIQSDWLGLPLSSRNEEAARILECVDGSFILHVQVEAIEAGQVLTGSTRA